MRGEKDIATDVTVLNDWAWTNPYYAINLEDAPTEIAEINLHPTGHIADVEPMNDYLIIPEKWNWEKHKLEVQIVNHKKKGKQLKIVKIKK
jgi:hypothetical protein